MADVDEDDMLWVLGLGKIGLGNSVAQSGSGGVVDETKDIQASDASSVDNSPPLDIGVPDWDGQNDVGDTDLELVRDDVSELPQVSTDELGGGEPLRLAEVFNLDADGSIDIDQIHIRERLLDVLDVGVRDGSADQPFKATNRVSKVGSLLGLCGFTNRSLFGTKRDE